MATETKKALQGGEFLIRSSEPQDIFIPEEFNEEQRMIAQTCVDFLEQHVWPQLDAIDKQQEADVFQDFRHPSPSRRCVGGPVASLVSRHSEHALADRSLHRHVAMVR